MTQVVLSQECYEKKAAKSKHLRHISLNSSRIYRYISLISSRVFYNNDASFHTVVTFGELAAEIR
jgi:hypothetical protein